MAITEAGMAKYLIMLMSDIDRLVFVLPNIFNASSHINIEAVIPPANLRSLYMALFIFTPIILVI